VTSECDNTMASSIFDSAEFVFLLRQVSKKRASILSALFVPTEDPPPNLPHNLLVNLEEIRNAFLPILGNP
jgi:hypothetical protein